MYGNRGDYNQHYHHNNYYQGGGGPEGNNYAGWEPNQTDVLQAPPPPPPRYYQRQIDDTLFDYLQQSSHNQSQSAMPLYGQQPQEQQNPFFGYSDFGDHNSSNDQDDIIQQHIIQQTIAWEQIQKQQKQQQQQEQQQQREKSSFSTLKASSARDLLSFVEDQKSPDQHASSTEDTPSSQEQQESESLYSGSSKKKKAQSLGPMSMTKLIHNFQASAGVSSSSLCSNGGLTPAPPAVIDTDDSVDSSSSSKEDSSSKEEDEGGQESSSVQIAERRLAQGQCPACGQQLYDMGKTKPCNNNGGKSSLGHKNNSSKPAKQSLWKRVLRLGSGSSHGTLDGNEGLGRHSGRSLRGGGGARKVASRAADHEDDDDEDEEVEEEEDEEEKEHEQQEQAPQPSPKKRGVDSRPNLPRRNSGGDLSRSRHRTQSSSEDISSPNVKNSSKNHNSNKNSNSNKNAKQKQILVRKTPLHIPGLVHRGQCVKCSLKNTNSSSSSAAAAAANGGQPSNATNNDVDDDESHLFLRDDEFEEDQYLQNSILQPLAAARSGPGSSNNNSSNKTKASSPSPSRTCSPSSVPSAALATYSGPVDASGERHGMGVLKWSNGDVFKGNFVHGVRQGPGTLTFAHGGGEYVGDWHHNTMHGQGTRRFPNGDLYTGPYVNGERHGPHGRFYFANGDLYVGDWQHDCMHGFGRYYYHHGQRFEGDFVCGQRHGKGKLQRLDGSLDIYRYRCNERAVNCVGVRWSADRTKAWKLVVPQYALLPHLGGGPPPAGKTWAVKKQAVSIAEAVSLVYEIENYESAALAKASGVATGHLQDVPTIAPSNTVV